VEESQVRIQGWCAGDEVGALEMQRIWGAKTRCER